MPGKNADGVMKIEDDSVQSAPFDICRHFGACGLHVFLRRASKYPFRSPSRICNPRRRNRNAHRSGLAGAAHVEVRVADRGERAVAYMSGCKRGG